MSLCLAVSLDGSSLLLVIEDRVAAVMDNRG